MAWKFSFTDQSVAEQSRFFYGANNCRVLKLGHILYHGILETEIISPYLDQMAGRTEVQKNEIPALSASQIIGATSADRYVDRAIREEISWLSTRQEGTGERHMGLLVSAMKLESLRLSEWLPEEVRQNIDPIALLLPAAKQNGYLEKYGEDSVLKTIGAGTCYAQPRPRPNSWSPNRPAVHRSGEFLVSRERI